MGKKSSSPFQTATQDLLRTKLALPRLRTSTVSRSTLLKTLDAGLEGKLTLLSAPAGFGKTTLISEWAAHLNEQNDYPAVAWLALDAGDNDPMRFWRYVIAACQTFEPSIGQSALAQLHAPRQPAFELILTVLINDLTALPGKRVLVLEDYNLITHPLIHESIAFLLDHLPLTLHLVIMTRSDPPLPLARLRARTELNELHSADLRFSPDETGALLQHMLSLPLTDSAVNELAAHTEGWAAGLQIAALALQGQSSVEEFLAHFSGSHRHILDYLAAEVFEAQSESIQEFLLQTSFLTRLTADLCNAVTGRDDSGAMLDSLERANLFLVPLDDNQQWYRYHALFAEAMQHYAQRHLGESRLCELHERASLWHEAHDFLEEAVEMALTACEYDRAATLIERIFELRRTHQELLTLRRWMESLPDSLRSERPVISLNHAMAILFSSDRYAPQTMALLDVPLSRAEKIWRESGELEHVGQALALRAMANWWQGEIGKMLSAASQSLELLSETDDFWRSITVGNIGMAELLSGNVPAARTSTSEALRLCRASDNPYGARAMLFMLGETSRVEGDLHQAAHYWRQVLAEATAVDDRTDAASALHSLGALACEWNDLNAAESYVTESLEIAHQLSDDVIHVQASLVLARIYISRREYTKAKALLESLVPLAHWSLLARPVYAYQAWVALLSGDMAAAQRWYNTYAQDDTDITHLQREQEAFLAARLLIHQGKAAEAIRLLDQWQPDAHDFLRTGSEVEIIMLKALAHFAQNHLSQAKKLLMDSLNLAKAGGYQRLFLNEGEPMAALLKMVLPEVDDDALITTVRALLYAFSREVSPQTIPNEGIPAPLSRQEQRVLNLLAAGMSYPQMADELVVSVNTIKTQVKSIYRKLNVENRDQASDLAQHLKLI